MVKIDPPPLDRDLEELDRVTPDWQKFFQDLRKAILELQSSSGSGSWNAGINGGLPDTVFSEPSPRINGGGP